MSEMSLAEALQEGLRDALRDDERVILLGEDVEAGGVFRVTEGLFEEFGPKRVFDTPLAESGFTGAAIGAALAGLRPIVEIQFVDFILPAVNQLISEAAKMRWRSQGDWSVPLVLRTPCGGGVHGGLYHSQSFEALFAHVPGLKVVLPSTPADARALLAAAIADPDPVIFLEHKRAYRLIRGEVPADLPPVPIGKAALRRTGNDLTLISYGLMVHECLQAADTLAGEGIDCHVLDLRTIAPLDHDAVLDAARRTGKVVIVHEDHLTGGVGGELAALIAAGAFEYLDGPIARVAGPDVPAMGYHLNLEAAFMPDAERIAAAARDLAAY